MSAVILSGKDMAAELLEQQSARVDTLRLNGIHPALAVIMVGEDPASAIYVRNKERACAKAGIASQVIRLPEHTTQEELHARIEELNEDPLVHGILIQLPLPKHLNETAALTRVRASKDVDGFHVINAGHLLQGHPTVLPCTPRGILYMLKKAHVPLEGAHAVVVGRSNIVGKPLALLLLGENCTVTLCHSRTRDLASVTRQADILVAAVGRPRLITADMVKPGAAVIDVGINRVDGKLCGDVDFDAVAEKAAYITPVPGGVGPMTVAMLLENTLEAACRA